MTSGEPPIRGAPLALSMRPRIELLLGRLAEGSGEQALADWSFSNLWLFRRAHDWRFVDGRWPLLEGRAYDGLRHVFPLFPLHEVPVSDWRALLGDCAAFYPLSASQVVQLPPQDGSREAVRDDADYLYEAGSFAEYRGAGLRKKRQLAARLEAAHAVSIAPYGEPLRAEAEQVLDGWLLDKGRSPGQADDLPCREALAAAAELGLAGWVLRADGVPAAFILTETLRPGVDVVRFAKGRAAFVGGVQVLFRHHARHGAPGAGGPPRWLNFEQDLGLANFRRTKLSYQPAALLEKFRVRPRCGTLSG